MPYTLPPITLTENQTSLVNIPGFGGSVTYLKMVNASPYLLAITNLLGGSDYLQPGEANVWPVPGLTTAVQVTPQQFALNPNIIPSSVLVVTWYLEGEAPTGSYPVNFNVLSYVGNNIQVNSATNVLEQDLFTPLVLAGITPSGTGTQIYGTTPGIAFTRQSDSSLLRTAVGATAQGPLSPSTTYFHDLNPDGTFSLGTSHSSQPNYLTIATVTTDAVAKISTITDTRVMSTILFNSMANVANAPGLVVYNLHVNKNIQADNQISVQGGFITTSGVGGTHGWQIVTEVDSELEFWPLGPSEQFVMFNVFNSGAGRPAPFAIGSGSSVLAPLAWIDDNGALHATAPVTLAAGNQETGAVGFGFSATAAGQLGLYLQNFKTVMSNIPTSITLSVGFSQNFSSVTADFITKMGFRFYFSSVAAGLSEWVGSYTTAGNCLLAVDGAARTFDHHCDACGVVTRAIPVEVATMRTVARGPASLCYNCPACGAVEAFNTALSAADEADTTPQGSGDYATTRGAQATLIRALMTALGLEVAP